MLRNKNLMELISENINELLKRRELILNFEGKGISFEEAKKEIAKKFKIEEELIDVYNIIGKFGRHIFEVLADIYNSKEDLEIMKKMRMSKKKKELEESAKKDNEQKEESS